MFRMSQRDFYSDILYAESRQARPPSKDFARVELTKDKLQIHHWMINSSRSESPFFLTPTLVGGLYEDQRP